MRELERAQRLALRIRAALVLHHRWKMPLEKSLNLGEELGMDQTTVRRFLLQNPAAFTVSSSGGDLSLSSAASDLLQQERLIYKEPRAAFVIRKLLMMSYCEMLPMATLVRCHSFDFPRLEPVLSHHPDWIHSNRLPPLRARLRLVNWDPDLAVTSREKALAIIQRSVKIPKRTKMIDQEQGEEEEEKIFGAGSRSGIIPMENDGGPQTMKSLQEIAVLYRQPMVSPYDRSRFTPANKELDRQRKISVVHEFLSLTPSKKAWVADLHCFWKEFGLDERRERLEALLRSETRLFTTTMSQGVLAVFLNERYDLDHTPAISAEFQAKRRFLDLVTAERSIQS